MGPVYDMIEQDTSHGDVKEDEGECRTGINGVYRPKPRQTDGMRRDENERNKQKVKHRMDTV